MLDNLKEFIKSNESEFILLLGVILISLISFSVGRLSAPSLEKQQITVEYLKASVESNSASAFQNNITRDSLQAQNGRIEGKFVASKNSTKYHLPKCSGAKRIAEHNKIWFESREEAESLGYTPAANCPELQ